MPHHIFSDSGLPAVFVMRRRYNETYIWWIQSCRNMWRLKTRGTAMIVYYTQRKTVNKYSVLQDTIQYSTACVKLHLLVLCIWSIDRNIVAKINIPPPPNICRRVTFLKFGLLIEKRTSGLKQYLFYVSKQHSFIVVNNAKLVHRRWHDINLIYKSHWLTQKSI